MLNLLVNTILVLVLVCSLVKNEKEVDYYIYYGIIYDENGNNKYDPDHYSSQKKHYNIPIKLLGAI